MNDLIRYMNGEVSTPSRSTKKLARERVEQAQLAALDVVLSRGLFEYKVDAACSAVNYAVRSIGNDPIKAAIVMPMLQNYGAELDRISINRLL